MNLIVSLSFCTTPVSLSSLATLFSSPDHSQCGFI
jgi:hypothetical protein